MRHNTRILIVVGLVVIGVALTVNVRKKDSNVEFVTQDRAKLEAEEARLITEEARLNAEKHWGADAFERMIFDSYCVRQPVSEKITGRAAELGIEITPFYDSTKIASIVITSRNPDPQFVRLLKESSASNPEIAEEREIWWEKNKERIKNEAEILRSQPEVMAARREVEKRLEEIGRMKGLTAAQICQLRYEALQEIAKAEQNSFGKTIPPAEKGNDQRK